MSLTLRDRDYVVGLNGLIFRVLGYTHPPDGYICDLEYVPSQIYRSRNPKAPRGYPQITHYKLYGDEPFKLVNDVFPEYRVFHKPLGAYLPGVPSRLIGRFELPHRGLERLMGLHKDKLVKALDEVLHRILESSRLRLEDFGVFGSLLFRFYHPDLSDLDIVIYGSKNLRRLRECLEEFYSEGFMLNEFESPPKGLNLRWRFKKYPYDLFISHQRRKLIYGLYKPPNSARTVKVEFEPVKSVDETVNEYTSLRRIVRLGWFKAFAKVLDDSEAAFMPSIYSVELEKVVEGPRVESVERVVSYVEEYRLQAFEGERIYVEGWLERVEAVDRVFHQITLTHGHKYYEQTLYSLDLVN